MLIWLRVNIQYIINNAKRIFKNCLRKRFRKKKIGHSVYKTIRTKNTKPINVWRVISRACEVYHLVTHIRTELLTYLHVYHILENCTWLEKIHGWQLKKQKRKENKKPKINCVGVCKPRTYWLTLYSWQARGNYHYKCLLYSVI